RVFQYLVKPFEPSDMMLTVKRALEAFQMEQDNEQEALGNLGSWSSPLVVGAPDIARKVVQDIRSPHAPLAWLTARHWPQGQQDRR
ncbi:MAG: hypothetical protein Q8Q15_01880, partial [bacterium]|nr:hypothetical protein [bacterium]